MASRIIEADCVEAMAEMDEASVDAIVCDPPYGLEFMGKEWDRFDNDKAWRRRVKEESDDADKDWGVFNRTSQNAPHLYVAGRAAQVWHQAWATQALRVLKPGGHLLAFGGTRTSHRLACAIEDAGFEIRDSVIWLYGSGFPKSLAVDKAIDRQRDDSQARGDVAEWLRPHVAAFGFEQVTDHFGFGDQTMVRTRWTTRSQPQTPTLAQWAELKDLLDLPADMDTEVWRLNGRKGQPGENWEKRELLGRSDEMLGRKSGIANEVDDHYTVGGTKAEAYDITAPATPQAQQWQGWGTALKPSHEPIVLARKPLVGTVAANVLEHGTGALNVDGCRVDSGTDYHDLKVMQGGQRSSGGIMNATGGERGTQFEPAAGRWPANCVLSHLPECERVGVRRVKGHRGYPNGPGGSSSQLSQKGTPTNRTEPWAGHADPDGTEQVAAWRCAPGCPVAELDRQSGERISGWRDSDAGTDTAGASFSTSPEACTGVHYGDTGGASRFLYQAKASRGERNAGLEGLNLPPESATYEWGDDKKVRVCDDCDRHFANNFDKCPRCGGAWSWKDALGGGVKGPRGGNHHPTVKPIDLMRWLCRLVTPPGGRILDCFAGSGTTGIAAHLEGFDFIGIEREPEYAEIARARIAWWERVPAGTSVEAALGLDASERTMREAGQDSLFG